MALADAFILARSKSMRASVVRRTLATANNMGNPMNEGAQSGQDADRGAVYGLLALLLLYPEEDTFTWLAEQPRLAGDDMLAGAWAAMVAASRCGPEQAMAVHETLFVGRGTPPIKPYQSAYVDGAVISPSLASLRQEMHRLGLQKARGFSETEDHLGVLLHAMRQLILHGAQPRTQADFFLKYIAPWAQRCLADIASHPRAGVYGSIARFAGAYLACETLEHKARLQAEISP